MIINLYRKYSISFFENRIISDIFYKKTHIEVSSYYAQEELKIGTENNLVQVNRLISPVEPFFVNLNTVNSFEVFTVKNYGTDIKHNIANGMELTFKHSCPREEPRMFKFVLRFKDYIDVGYFFCKNYEAECKLLDKIANFFELDTNTFFDNARKNIIKIDNSFTFLEEQDK